MTRRKRDSGARWGVALLVCFGATHVARAQGSDVLLAHPEAPVTSVGWRGQVRGTVALRIPVIDPVAHHGIGLAIEPLVELHNEVGSDQPLPNENWRGRLAIATWWERRHEDRSLRHGYLGLAVQHESDHQTARSGAGVDALQLNDLTIRGGMTLAPRAWGVHVRAEARVLAISCTRVASGCRDFHGSASAGGAVDVAFDLGANVSEPTRWYFVSALHLGGIVAHRAIVGEGRAILQAGFWKQTPFGRWQLVGLVWLGHDVGFDRARSVTQAGAAIRWAP
jgi:hypothetical protein